MLQIQDTLVSLDLAERFFCCDLSKCMGECCIEGDAGAPITREEYEKLKEVLPVVSDDLTPAGRKEIEERGVGYVDEEGDLVTTIVNGRDCAFCTYGPGGVCLCAVEKAYREGRIKDFRKPASCALYPVRLTRYPSFTELSSLEGVPCRRGAWPQRGDTPVSVPRRAAYRIFRKGVVRRTEIGL